MKATELTCYVYKVGKDRKDLHLSVKLDEFDPSKLTLLEDDLNPENFKILYDGRKFRLFIENLYGKVKKSRLFESHYLSVKDDITKNKKCLYEVFFAIKELVTGKVTDDMCGFIDWNKIWLNCTKYDLTEKDSYHFEKLYLALDGVICVMDPFLKNYKLGCEMIHGCVYLCEKCDTFLL